MKFRDILFRVHLVFGLSVGLVVLFLSVTGAMLSFRPQILAFAEHGVYSSNDAPKDSKVRAFMKQVEVLHRWFGMSGDLKPMAHQIKGVCNIIFFVMIVTGFYLWWPRNWRWKTLQSSIQFNGALKGRARDWNWHNVIGFWCAPFLILITLTGIIMSYQSPRREGPPREHKVEMVNEARDGQRVREHKSEIMIEVKDSKPDANRQFRRLVKTTHTGEVGGLIGQVLAFLASIGAIFLVWTGLSMSWQRFCAWRLRTQIKP